MQKKYKDAEVGFKKAIEIYRSCDEYTEDMKYTYFNLIALYKSHYKRVRNTKIISTKIIVILN